MLDFTEVKHKQRQGVNHSINSSQVTEVWWKDCVQEQRAYTYFAQKLAETYENFTNKAKFIRPFCEEIFKNVPTFGELSTDALVKGFFFMFVLKDFIIREILSRVADQLPLLKQRRILD